MLRFLATHKANFREITYQNNVCMFVLINHFIVSLFILTFEIHAQGEKGSIGMTGFQGFPGLPGHMGLPVRVVYSFSQFEL